MSSIACWNTEDEENENVMNKEAHAVMLALLLETENDTDIARFHQQIGHVAFNSLALSSDEKEEVNKVHRYFGHRSGRRVWDVFAKAKKLEGKKKAVLAEIEKCKVCSKFKKSPPRPKVGIPVANDFNEVVGLDLKVVDKEKGYYILWLVDQFSKLIKGKFIKDKKPSTIIQGIISTWIVGDGAGPGHPKRSFWSDNGGEFLNEELIDFAAALNINIKMTAGESPWQNGTVERHHATCDIIVAKLRLENPSLGFQEAVNHAAFAKNCEINSTRFSPLQLMTGQSPHFPGLDEVNPSSCNLDSSSKYMKNLKTIDAARLEHR